MLQTGTLYSPSNNENSVEFKKPLPNVYIYFSQNGVRKYTVKTDATGAFSVDLALGSYQVTISQGAGFEIFPLGGGAPFELTKDSAVDAFEKWVLAPVYLKPEENPLVVLLNSLVLDARTSATDAKTEADRAEQAVSDSVGSGRLMREGSAKSDFLSNVGAYYTSNNPPPKLKRGMSGISQGLNFRINNPGLDFSDLGLVYNFLYFEVQGAYFSGDDIVTFRDARGHRQISLTRRNSESEWTNLTENLTDRNTTVDSNGFIKSASPIIKLFDDRIETNGQFKEEPVFEKIGVGTYKISNTLGLAKEGWYIETPRDRNGFPYFLVEWEQDENNVVTIRTFKRKIDLETLDFVNGEPVDIGEDQRWIDLRFHEEEVDDEELYSQLDNLDKSAH